MPKCLPPGFRLVDAEKGLGGILFMGEFLVGAARNPNDQLIGSQVISTHAWRTMPFATTSSQEALSELSGWETSLLGPPKKNDPCHIFLQISHFPLKVCYDFSPLSELRLLPLQYFPMEYSNKSM